MQMRYFTAARAEAARVAQAPSGDDSQPERTEVVVERQAGGSVQEGRDHDERDRIAQGESTLATVLPEDLLGLYTQSTPVLRHAQGRHHAPCHLQGSLVVGVQRLQTGEEERRVPKT
jgi:hypothetical protein